MSNLSWKGVRPRHRRDAVGLLYLDFREGLHAGHVDVRRMFNGWGFYRVGLLFGAAW